MKSVILGILFLIIYAQADEWETYYEKSNFLETPRYEQTIEFCKKMADASKQITYRGFGMSPQGRELPLLIVDKNGNSEPQPVKESGKAILFIEAGIHAGEIDGKDAGLMLIRDLVLRDKYPGLLDHVTILFVPIFSVDGHERFSAYNRFNQNGPKEMGWRVTAQNLNLNRDFVKADAPEMQAWLKLFQKWLPDFFVDCHVTDGADYQYVVTYSIEIRGNMPDGITEWTKQNYLPQLESAMAAEGYLIFPYVAFREKHNPLSGVNSWVCKPKLAHGYTAIQNRQGLLIETHMFKPYKQRVSGTYYTLLHTLRIMDQQYEQLKRANLQSDQYTASAEFRKRPFPLLFEKTADTIMIDYAGYSIKKENSEVSDTVRVIYESEPENIKIPFYHKQKPKLTVQLPEAYIVPAEWTSVIQRLEWHGVQYERLKDLRKFKIETYRFKNVRWQQKPYEGRHPLTYQYDVVTLEKEFPAGSVLIPMNQRTAPVAAHLLEPDAPDALVSWGFFDAIFEYKEYAELYVLEDYARERLASDPELKAEFEKKLSQDPEFAASSKKRLYFFYENSPYWDSDFLLYPVGRIMK